MHLDARRLRVAVVAPVFPPEPVVSSKTTADVVDALASEGHDVTVLTAFPNRPAGRVYDGYSRTLFSRERRQSGAEVVRCFAFCSRQSTLLSRFMENISFGFTTSLRILFMKRRPDVVYSLSWPIFASALLAAVARVRHIPIVSNVQDIYPESLVAQGRLSSEGFVFRLLRMTDQALMSRSRAVILISEQSKQSYISCRGLPSAKIAVIPNWGDSEAAAPDPLAGLELRKRMGIRDTDVLAVFAGNVGAAANVESVIEAMVEMDDPRLFLLIAGEGSSLAACEALAAKSAAARRIIFHHPWHISETSGILSSADLMLLPTRGRQSLVSTPSKLLAYMLVGKPVLATGFANSDLAEIIANAGCGWLIEPDNPSRLANMLRQLLAKSSDELKTRGHAGRLYVQQKLSKQACVPRIVELLQSCADASC